MEDLTVALQRKRMAQLDETDNYLQEMQKRIAASGKSVEAAIKSELNKEVNQAVKGLHKQMDQATKALKIDPNIAKNMINATREFVKANQFSATTMMKYAKGDLTTVIKLTEKQVQGIQKTIGQQQQ